jgi:hypothetical protein
MTGRAGATERRMGVLIALTRLLRARCLRPRCCRAPNQRDELAAFQLIELHSVPVSQGRIIGYRIGEDQSAGIASLAGRSRWQLFFVAAQIGV